MCVYVYKYIYTAYILKPIFKNTAVFYENLLRVSNIFLNMIELLNTFLL